MCTKCTRNRKRDGKTFTAMDWKSFSLDNIFFSFFSCVLLCLCTFRIAKTRLNGNSTSSGNKNWIGMKRIYVYISGCVYMLKGSKSFFFRHFDPFFPQLVHKSTISLCYFLHGWQVFIDSYTTRFLCCMTFLLQSLHVDSVEFFLLFEHDGRFYCRGSRKRERKELYLVMATWWGIDLGGYCLMGNWIYLNKEFYWTWLMFLAKNCSVLISRKSLNKTITNAFKWRHIWRPLYFENF